MSMWQRLNGHATFSPDKVAIDSDDGTLTYHQLSVLVERCVDYFHSLNLGEGDRVAVLALNHPDWFIALFAAARCGVVLVPLNWRLSVDELQYVLNDASPALLLHDQAFADTANQLKPVAEQAGVCHGGFTRSEFGSADFPPAAPTAAVNRYDSGSDANSNPLLIVYTSGTTGRPKGAVLSEQSLMCSAAMSQHMLDLTSGDCVLNVLPLFHVGGLNIQPLPALLYGATLVLHSRFNPEQTVATLVEKHITLITTVPTVLQAMLSVPQWQSDAPFKLRAMSIGSTDVPLHLIQKVHSHGIPVLQIYGATETSPVAIYQRLDNAHIEGSIGKAGLLCQIRLVDSNGQLVARGESGEIEVQGNNILSAYWNNNEATKSAINNGWFATGDVAHEDENGFYWFDDRLKHVIISGGENVYPAEIERLIATVPGVQEVAVVGKADAQWGEVPTAIVVGNVDEALVLEACSSIARFKQPREVKFVDSLPRNALGKIQITAVKKLFD